MAGIQAPLSRRKLCGLYCTSWHLHTLHGSWRLPEGLFAPVTLLVCRFRKDVPDHAAFRFVPFGVETCGYMGKEAVVKFLNRLRDIAAESGCIPKGAFVGNAAAAADGAPGEC